MKIINTKSFNINKNSVLTLGNFDGIHLGHQELIKGVKKACESSNLASVVFSFYPHPVSVINHNSEFCTIFNQEEKALIIDEMNMDYLIQYPFDKEFAAVTAEEFVDMLVKMTGLKTLVIGEDYGFGKNRHGNLELLENLGKDYGFNVIAVPKVNFNGSRISSTRIRECISNKDFHDANLMLGRSYFVKGVVVQGEKIGKKIGFPTANILIPKEKLVPPDGVYITKTQYNGKTYNSITNIGKNPTVNGLNKTIETNIFDFDKEIYGEDIIVSFCKWIRDENKFNNLSELKAQIQKDKAIANKYFK